MKLVILTTETIHHTRFVQEISEEFEVESVFIETQIHQASFETEHPFEARRDEYEKDTFFGGKRVSLRDVSSVFEVDSVNSPEAIQELKRVCPDVVLVFGTGLIHPAVIEQCSSGMVNLHGGAPELYRGLDSHLWAIYHEDFSSLTTTLHRVNTRLDDGDIILEEQLPITRDMPLYQLRAMNTDVCLRMSLAALDMYSRFGTFVTRRQRDVGRYYSFMPSCMKEICMNKFAKHVASL